MSTPLPEPGPDPTAAARSAPARRAGFTLAELLAVIAIMGIIILAALPALKTIPSTALQVASRQVANDLLLAREYAITRRANVRFCMVVDGSTAGLSNLICRAYTCLIASNDSDNAVTMWVPLQEWRFLPQGIIFSDHNTGAYDPINRLAPAPLGLGARTVASGTTTNPAALTFSMFMTGMTNVLVYAGATSSNVWSGSVVEFTPSGQVTGITGSGSNFGGAIRLVQGAVQPTNGVTQLIVADVNNWVYIEYDQYSGRIRVRNPESYQ